MKKIKYIIPIINVVEIEKTDIVVTSGPIPTKLTDALFGAGKSGVNVG